MLSTIYLLWHKSPKNPSGHLHRTFPDVVTTRHVPLFWQGLGWQAFPRSKSIRIMKLEFQLCKRTRILCEKRTEKFA